MMIALSKYQHQGTGVVARCVSHRELSFRQEMSRRYWSLASKQRRLANIIECFRNQPALLPLQCAAALEELATLRRAVEQAEAFLDEFEPATTQRLRPYACIAKLRTLGALLAELTLTVAMFAPICQAITHQRVELHLDIRSLFPRVRCSFEDTVSQFAALMSQEREEALQ